MQGTRLSPVSTLPLLIGQLGLAWEEDGFSFRRLEACKAMKSWTSQGQLPMSTSATRVSLWPAGPGPADSHHCVAHIHPFVAL